MATTNPGDKVVTAYSSEFAAVCRDLGYEIGSSLKPKRKAELMTALASINTLYLNTKHNTSNLALNGFVFGVLAALENPAEKSPL